MTSIPKRALMAAALAAAVAGLSATAIAQNAGGPGAGNHNILWSSYPPTARWSGITSLSFA